MGLQLKFLGENPLFVGTTKGTSAEREQIIEEIVTKILETNPARGFAIVIMRRETMWRTYLIPDHTQLGLESTLKEAGVFKQKKVAIEIRVPPPFIENQTLPYGELVSYTFDDFQKAW